MKVEIRHRVWFMLPDNPNREKDELDEPNEYGFSLSRVEREYSMAIRICNEPDIPKDAKQIDVAIVLQNAETKLKGYVDDKRIEIFVTSLARDIDNVLGEFDKPVLYAHYTAASIGRAWDVGPETRIEKTVLYEPKMTHVEELDLKARMQFGKGMIEDVSQSPVQVVS